MPNSIARTDTRQAERERMVTEQLIRRGVRDPRVLAAMRKIPRHRFLPDANDPRAYDDTPLPIGYGQSISQPFVVGSMSEHLAVTAESRVLEIGTGCGYQTAILAELATHVYSVELIEPLFQETSQRLTRMDYKKPHIDL